jgi:hypothetical protein
VQTPVNFMKSGGLTRSGGSAQIDGKIARIQNLMCGTLLFFPQALGRMEFALPAQSLEAPDATIYRSNHALFAFKTLACSQVVSGANERALRLFQFQSAAQLIRINLPASMTQGLSHQFVIAHNGVAFKEMLFRVLK